MNAAAVAWWWCIVLGTGEWSFWLVHSTGRSVFPIFHYAGSTRVLYNRKANRSKTLTQDINSTSVVVLLAIFLFPKKHIYMKTYMRTGQENSREMKFIFFPPKRKKKRTTNFSYRIQMRVFCKKYYEGLHSWFIATFKFNGPCTFWYQKVSLNFF